MRHHNLDRVVQAQAGTANAQLCKKRVPPQRTVEEDRRDHPFKSPPAQIPSSSLFLSSLIITGSSIIDKPPLTSSLGSTGSSSRSGTSRSLYLSSLMGLLARPMTACRPYVMFSQLFVNCVLI
ncbi:hypothetical protein J6590_001896 [Homalodisca vitripennis]|nr:hypothetical protein J6590_001896 [Homalodisca vitripennis]